KEGLILKEILDFELLLFKKNIDAYNPNDRFYLELRLPYTREIEARKVHPLPPQEERLLEQGEDCPTLFFVDDIKKIRYWYNEVILYGEKEDYSRTAPNQQHLYDDAPL